jgi:hypothetical protein
MVEESVVGARKLTGSHLAALNDPCLLRQKRERLPPLMDAKKEFTFVLWGVWPRTSASKENDSERTVRCAVAPSRHRNRTSQPDSLHLAQCNFVLVQTMRRSYWTESRGSPRCELTGRKERAGKTGASEPPQKETLKQRRPGSSRCDDASGLT